MKLCKEWWDQAAVTVWWVQLSPALLDTPRYPPLHGQWSLWSAWREGCGWQRNRFAIFYSVCRGGGQAREVCTSWRWPGPYRSIITLELYHKNIFCLDHLPIPEPLLHHQVWLILSPLSPACPVPYFQDVIYTDKGILLSSEKAMAPHSSTLAWKIPWMEEPGGLQSMGLLRVRHDWVTSLSLFTSMHWRRKWQPTPVFLPGESQGRGSLVGCCLWGRTVGHDWSDLAAPSPVFLPGESHGQKSLASYLPWGLKESDMTERLTHTHYHS